MNFKLAGILLVVAITHGCNRPEDKLVGIWEYDNYEIDESRIGFLAGFYQTNGKKASKPI